MFFPTGKMFVLVDWEGESSVSVVPYSLVSCEEINNTCWVRVGRERFRGKILAKGILQSCTKAFIILQCIGTKTEMECMLEKGEVDQEQENEERQIEQQISEIKKRK